MVLFVCWTGLTGLSGCNANSSHLFFFFIVCLNFKTGMSCVHWIIGLFYLDRINWIFWIVFLLCQILDKAGRKQSAFG